MTTQRPGHACRVALVDANTKLLHVRYYHAAHLPTIDPEDIYWLTHAYHTQLFQQEQGAFVVRSFEKEAAKLDIPADEFKDVITGVWHSMGCHGPTALPITFYVEDYP